MPLSQDGKNRGGKSAHSITGVPGFSYVYRFSRHYGGVIHEGSISGVCGVENVISEKRLRDHFHEHCESLTPTGFSLRAMASCTPSHQRDMDIGIDDTDSIAHAAVVCQEGARKKHVKRIIFSRKKARWTSPVRLSGRDEKPHGSAGSTNYIPFIPEEDLLRGSGETFIKKPPQTRFSPKGWKRKRQRKKKLSASCGKRHRQQR